MYARYNRNTNKTHVPRRPKEPGKVYDADIVWAAAAYAQRINGEYVKTMMVDIINKLPDEANINAKEPNRSIVEKVMTDIALLSQQDLDKGKEIRNYYKGLTFRVLSGQPLNDFDNSAMTIASKDQIFSTSSFDFSVIISLPSCYERAVKRDDVNRRINFATGGMIGKIGDKVTTNIEVIKSTFSQQWGIYFITGVTDKDQVLFFSYREGLDIGTIVNIKGTVKAHRDNCTQLNRVKIL